MRFILSLVATLIVTVAVLDLLQVTNLMTLGNRVHRGAKTISVAKPEGGDWQQMRDKTLKAAKHMLGLDTEPEKSELEQLMERRRKETAPMQTFQF
ncbi:hypothetical protein [Phaeobacter gallaeciensis]|uniref:Uncharacterized protein n=1 Tax=Phaeobacter gallaeciensis TaxID=60890 RepID=A0AAC9Z9S4_9RHOB|nr:hypothetical protein [Phaeobacter gallaeciensis]AHD09898.1 hypothetical protein Gal_02150 [Phaeobacter gallaeciensis DSM 26640]ATE93162.1 hypothetical protein PhaeoP11_02141 [Phaeobacter gallaeciensis]ATE97016.1 hypothetical protein PhaeoP73_01705 [Phaeobacter gallaeciensis]ATF01827.1 hypothetical protein PhaeoP75_02191 [Phaeobacter gallaeciensis]ATF06207.1 hypothetical protein PhaeoP63_02140 [Phaeobacter gallaeciensis]